MTARLLKYIAIAALATAPVAASAVTSTYSDRTVFETENPGLATEDFEAANVASGSTAGFTGTLSSATNNSVFTLGSVLDGFTMSVGPSNRIYVENNYSHPTKSVSSDLFSEDITLDFAPAITAVGVDLLGWFSGSVSWTVEVGGLASTHTTNVSTPGFFGIATSDGFITSLFLDKPDSGGVIDNLTFGAGSVGTIPLPGGFPLIAGGLLAFGFLRRKTQA